MTADPYYFAAVGACKSNSNPIEKARKLLRQVQNSGEFSKYFILQTSWIIYLYVELFMDVKKI